MLLVAAALIERHGRILLTRRPEGVHLAGLWEFPGGKLEPGEGPDQALARELREELGVETRAAEPFLFSHHRYPAREVLILLYRCAIAGEPQALGAAGLGWFTPAEAAALPLPDADRPFLAALLAPAVAAGVRDPGSPAAPGGRSR